jgi:hypothetical protein
VPAGLGGFGGSSYIDAMIERLRDMSNGWAGAADGTMEEARYYCQKRGAGAAIVKRPVAIFGGLRDIKLLSDGQ